MHVLLKEPARHDSQRSDAAASAAGQAIVGDEFGYFIPCMISAPDSRYPFEGFHPPDVLAPPAPLAVAIAGSAGIAFMKGKEYLKRLTLKKLLRMLPDNLEHTVISDLRAANAALAEAKRILLENEQLFRELQEETYRYGSYLPKPETIGEQQ